MGLYGYGDMTSTVMTLSNVTANSNTAGGGALLVLFGGMILCGEVGAMARSAEQVMQPEWGGGALAVCGVVPVTTWLVAGASTGMVRMFMCDGEQVTVVGCSCTHPDTVR
jgi:hypothetical protein